LQQHTHKKEQHESGLRNKTQKKHIFRVAEERECRKKNPEKENFLSQEQKFLLIMKNNGKYKMGKRVEIRKFSLALMSILTIHNFSLNAFNEVR
jgi:hypothetical protein